MLSEGRYPMNTLFLFTQISIKAYLPNTDPGMGFILWSRIKSNKRAVNM